MSEKDEGLFKKPLKGSFKRVRDRMSEDMTEKTPSEAVRDDLGGGTSEPTDEERANLDRSVESERAKRSD